MSREAKEYWDNVKDYHAEITAVFAVRNKLTKCLENIPNKSEMMVADFGCGCGDAIPYLQDFKKIYAIDFSDNMLNQTKQNYGHLDNISFIQDDLKKLKFCEKCDCGLAASSIFPDNYEEFDDILQGMLRNIKSGGTLIMTLASFEALTLLYQFRAHKWSDSIGYAKALEHVTNTIQKTCYNPFGYITTQTGTVQKYWLKDEIEFRLHPYKLKNIKLEKLEMDWDIQMKDKAMLDYPKFWLWLLVVEKI